MKPDYQSLLTLAITAAEKASEEILKVYHSGDFQAEAKGDKSPLTLADKNAHHAIAAILQSSNLPILSEEGKTIPYDERKNWEYFWMVDPLDGTKEFIKRNDEFTVNIALIHQGVPVMGVVVVPVTGDVYYSTAGQGAYLKRAGKEIKLAGGDGPPLRFGQLSFPDLEPVRTALLDDLVELSADREASRKALGLSPKQDAEIERNAALRSAPTLPAIDRYTGVLYDALDVGSLRGAAAARARQRLMVGSALFGLLRAGDPVPAYRLSAAAKLPGSAPLTARWRPALEPLLADLAARELVVDLRSGSYAALGRVSAAVRVDVLAEHPDGRRTVVSHFNKAHKGRLARALATTRAEPSDTASVATVARRAGMRVERDGDDLVVVVPA